MLKITKPNSSICGNLLSQYELSTITLHRRTKIQQVTLYIANLGNDNMNAAWIDSLRFPVIQLFILCP